MEELSKSKNRPPRGGQPIFQQRCQAFPWGKESLQKMVLKQLNDIHSLLYEKLNEAQFESHEVPQIIDNMR